MRIRHLNKHRFVRLFTGFTSVSADYINDNILIEDAKNGSDILIFHIGDYSINTANTTVAIDVPA